MSDIELAVTRTKSLEALLAAGHQVLWVPGQRIDGAETAARRFVRLELLSAGRAH